MATKKRKPKAKSQRQRAIKRAGDRLMQRLTSDVLVPMVRRAVAEGLQPQISAEVRYQLSDGRVERELHALWQRKYSEQIDRRVVDVVRSLRLRFAEARSDQLFDIETEDGR